MFSCPSAGKMASESTFDSWLSDKLSSISPDIDLEVFVSYFMGILDTDSPKDEKDESIKELLSDLVPAGIPDLDQQCLDILKKWDDTMEKKDDQENKASLDEKLATIMEKQKISVAKPKNAAPTKEEKERKAAILAQYSQVHDGPGSDDDDEGDDEGASCGFSGGGDDLMTKNSNAAAVDQKEKVQREKMKEDSDKKKLKDKEDREKQKSKVQDRKDQEKKRTQKGERRR